MAVASPMGQTIAVVDKSGKVVSTGKHFVNIFKEAKAAYRERKAEINAERNAERRARHQAKAAEREARRAMKAMQIEDGGRDDARRDHHHRSGTNSQPGALTRRHTAAVPGGEHARAVGAPAPTRRHTEPESHIDMDLAYGELPPPHPSDRQIVSTNNNNNNDDAASTTSEDELKEKMSLVTQMLDELDAVHHSATQTIQSLEQNPEALAAVALTLAEISNLLAKFSPAVLTTLKTSFPAVVALLASPQFMIAAGVGVGVTIVALGGYKIIKHMMTGSPAPAQPVAVPAPAAQQQALPAPPAVDEDAVLDELVEKDLSRIERWRRGIAGVDATASEKGEGSKVDSELITPGGRRFFSKLGVLDEEEIRSRRSGGKKKVKRRVRVGKGREEAGSEGEKEKEKEKEGWRRHHKSGGGGSATRSKTWGGSEVGSEKSGATPAEWKRKKVKEPSALRTLFTR